MRVPRDMFNIFYIHEHGMHVLPIACSCIYVCKVVNSCIGIAHMVDTALYIFLPDFLLLQEEELFNRMSVILQGAKKSNI